MGEALSGESQLRRAMSDRVDEVELGLKQFFRCTVSENLSGQTVDAIGEKTYLVRSVVGNALSFRNEPAQHPVMTFVCTFLPGGIRMGKIYFQRPVLQQRKISKL